MKTYQEKLKLIQKITKKTQVELADFLDVSFPTINSWLLGKSQPRKSAQEKIDILFQQYTGELLETAEVLTTKQTQLEKLKKSHTNPYEIIMSRPDLYNQFLLSLTYHTNSIEGSTFKEPEVRAVLFDNAVIVDRTVKEHQEVKNHQAALGYIMTLLAKKSKHILTEDVIKNIHKILMNGILHNAGNYRNHSVRITGSHVATVNYVSIQKEMKKLIQELQKNNHNYVSHIALMHSKFEQIHPFSDGNGRVGRLVMVIMALQNNLAPIIITQERKRAYYKFLQESQLKNNHAPLISFLYDALFEGYALFY